MVTFVLYAVFLIGFIFSNHNMMMGGAYALMAAFILLGFVLLANMLVILMGKVAKTVPHHMLRDDSTTQKTIDQIETMYTQIIQTFRKGVSRDRQSMLINLAVCILLFISGFVKIAILGFMVSCVMRGALQWITLNNKN